MSFGLLGKKIGMTQINDTDGRRIAVSVVEVGPCVVVQKKTNEKDGYAAVKIAFGEKRVKSTKKPEKALYEKLKSTPKRWMREFRVGSEELGKYQEGQEVKVDQVFKAGQIVDVTGRTKGHGTTGVMVRWNMKGNDAGHGTHEFFRHQGSIGTRTWPGWVHRGKRMGGHYGDERVTTANLRIVQILADKNVVLVEGSVPGKPNGCLEIKPAANVKLATA
jgi:large subunit ribosomal protein L3